MSICGPLLWMTVAGPAAENELLTHHTRSRSPAGPRPFLSNRKPREASGGFRGSSAPHPDRVGTHVTVRNAPEARSGRLITWAPPGASGYSSARERPAPTRGSTRFFPKAGSRPKTQGLAAAKVASAKTQKMSIAERMSKGRYSRRREASTIHAVTHPIDRRQH